MNKPRIVVIATLETKQEESDFLCQCLENQGVEPITLDMSLNSGGMVLGGEEKHAAISKVIERTVINLGDHLEKGIDAVIGIGGGTGGEIALKSLGALPITFPKILVTTLPFDPRIAMADNSIVLVPTLVDICGLNATLREVFENAAAIACGICRTRRRGNACIDDPSIGITALGATEAATSNLVKALKKTGQETTVFHGNGFGGAAFARFAERGAFRAIIDQTPHELTRLFLAGAHVEMPGRFTAASALPRIMLPGALNFIGLGEKSLIPESYRGRAHYEHSNYFTHIKLEPDEMRLVATKLTDCLNNVSGPAALIVPMGGFSHQDIDGGAIEDRELREVFLQTIQEKLSPKVGLHITEAHINEVVVSEMILATLDDLTEQRMERTNVSIP